MTQQQYDAWIAALRDPNYQWYHGGLLDPEGTGATCVIGKFSQLNNIRDNKRQLQYPSVFGIFGSSLEADIYEKNDDTEDLEEVVLFIESLHHLLVA